MGGENFIEIQGKGMKWPLPRHGWVDRHSDKWWQRTGEEIELTQCRCIRLWQEKTLVYNRWQRERLWSKTQLKRGQRTKLRGQTWLKSKALCRTQSLAGLESQAPSSVSPSWSWPFSAWLWAALSAGTLPPGRPQPEGPPGTSQTWGQHLELTPNYYNNFWKASLGCIRYRQLVKH